jgi:protein-disulfide isomerase
MRRVWVFVAAALCSCHHDDSKSERDTKGRANAIIGDNPAAPPVMTPTMADTTVHRVPIGTSPGIGGKSALVTIVEFSDFQCPYCKRAEPTLSALRVKYGDDLRVVWKNEPMPNHDRAKPAAELAMTARDQRGDAMFWTVHDDLFASPTLDDATLAGVASAHGVKQTAAHHKALDDDHTLAATLGVTAIPVFFVNGRKIIGAQDEATFSGIIDTQLADAKSRVAKGTPPDKVYDEVMAAAQ